METKSIFSRTEADEIIALIKEKLKANTSKQKGIRATIRRRGFHANEFGLHGGYTVADFLRYANIAGTDITKAAEPVLNKQPVTKPPKSTTEKASSRSHSDESYVIDLCDEILKKKALRQHQFDFLKGDSGRKLPVDAYYPDLNLVVEFREKQHSETVKFFDRRQTVSGMGRGEQRKLYDQRRREVLPEHGIKVIELSYVDFDHKSDKKLVRQKDKDIKVVKEKLQAK